VGLCLSFYSCHLFYAVYRRCGLIPFSHLRLAIFSTA